MLKKWLALGAFLLSFSHPGVLAKEQSTSWAVKMADSEMVRFPEAWQIEWREKGRWDYTHGLELMAFIRLFEQTREQKYYDYVRDYVDLYVKKDGSIDTYVMEKYNIDMINAGKLLFFMYDQTGKRQYRTAMDTLRRQLTIHPRTSEGGFWHKKRYPFQMWLDGLYMGAPFYAEYTRRYGDFSDFDDVVLQFELIEKHLYDAETGLPRHGWDESREQRWADDKTGLSPHHWSRSIGWYAMALADTLDILPLVHPKRDWLEGRLENLVKQMVKYQHASGLWYQVTDQGDREGNYLEASGTAMMAYAIARAVNKGNLDAQYIPVAEKAFDGMVRDIVSEENGLYTLNQVCAVAGLGGNPYRDGSFEYYISEPIRPNDPKGMGPFILAALELGR